MMRGTEKESTPGTTALNPTEGSGVMARKMVWGTSAITLTLLRKKDSGGATRLSNGYQKTMMMKVKMERASSVRIFLTGKTIQIKSTFPNRSYKEWY